MPAAETSFIWMNKEKMADASRASAPPKVEFLKKVCVNGVQNTAKCDKIIKACPEPSISPGSGREIQLGGSKVHVY
jgi:hypothetical protein